ncbi:MAG: ABC transporter substrate-binding protein [Acidobacteria bacterium]|nr:ABC transporter substrate-binding protein [Acidobacteriota bacterium]
MAQIGGPRGFNRLFVDDQETAAISDAIMGSLVSINRQTQQVEPALAERWAFTDNGRVLSLHLRHNVLFSDGQPFTADDLVFTFAVILDDRTQSAAGRHFSPEGKKVLVEKVDGHTVRLTFPQAMAGCERWLDGVPILPKHRLESHFKNGSLATAWNLAAARQAVVGLGPFRLKQYLSGQRTVVERNPYYWKQDAQGHALPYLDELIFEIIPDKNAQQLRFQQAQLDVLKPLVGHEAAALRDLEKKGAVKIYNVGPSLINDIFWFNQNELHNKISGKAWGESCRLSWFQMLPFRQAVSYAIDREAIIRLVFGGYASTSWGPITSGNRLWYNPHVRQYPYDLEKARALLRSAGFTYRGDQLYDGRGNVVAFSLSTNAGNAVRQKMSAMIQQDLSRIGMKVTLAPTETKALINRIDATHDYEACLLSLLSGDVDPSAEMNVLHSRGALHWWRPKQSQPATAWEQRIDALMVEQQRVFDFARRKQLFDEVQEIMAEQQAFIYLAARQLIVATKSNLGNVKPGVLNDFILWNCDELYWQK